MCVYSVSTVRRRRSNLGRGGSYSYWVDHTHGTAPTLVSIALTRVSPALKTPCTALKTHVDTYVLTYVKRTQTFLTNTHVDSTNICVDLASIGPSPPQSGAQAHRSVGRHHTSVQFRLVWVAPTLVWTTLTLMWTGVTLMGETLTFLQTGEPLMETWDALIGTGVTLVWAAFTFVHTEDPLIGKARTFVSTAVAAVLAVVTLVWAAVTRMLPYNAVRRTLSWVAEFETEISGDGILWRLKKKKKKSLGLKKGFGIFCTVEVYKVYTDLHKVAYTPYRFNVLVGYLGPYATSIDHCVVTIAEACYYRWAKVKGQGRKKKTTLNSKTILLRTIKHNSLKIHTAMLIYCWMSLGPFRSFFI